MEGPREAPRDDDSVLRRKIVGDAIRELREQLQVTLSCESVMPDTGDIEGQREVPKDEAAVLRRKIVGNAVRELRDHLQVSQPQLAARIGRRTDPGSVSRWERGLKLPEAWKRKKLSAIARTAGRHDLAECFSDTFAWRWGLRTTMPKTYDLMVLSDILLGNLGPNDREYHDLKTAIVAGARTLGERHAEGDDIVLFDDDQRDVWLRRIVRGEPEQEED